MEQEFARALVAIPQTQLKVLPCSGVAGWLFGHAFDARFDTEPRVTDLSSVDDAYKEEVLEAGRAYTYRCDVCARCGRIAWGAVS